MYLRIQKEPVNSYLKVMLSDKPSQYVDMILFILILLNVTAVCLESVKDIGEAYKDTFYAFEIFSVVIFSLEYLLRVWSAPTRQDLGNSSGFVKRLKYIFSFTGLVDFLAIIPSILPYFFGGLDLRWLRVLRLLRLLKISITVQPLKIFFQP